MIEVRSEDIENEMRHRSARSKASSHACSLDFGKITKFGAGVKQRAIQRVFDDTCISAQHGPVRVIMKDGKYVDEEAQTK